MDLFIYLFGGGKRGPLPCQTPTSSVTNALAPRLRMLERFLVVDEEHSYRRDMKGPGMSLLVVLYKLFGVRLGVYWRGLVFLP